jgi:hypothetical protein
VGYQRIKENRLGVLTKVRDLVEVRQWIADCCV